MSIFSCTSAAVDAQLEKACFVGADGADGQ